MLHHRGFNAWIQAGGEQLPECLVNVDEDHHSVSCWIPGKEGETFTVYWEDQGGKVDTCSFIFLDGFPVSGRFLKGTGITSRGGLRTSENTERPFMFQKALDEALEESPTASIFEETGTIILKIKRCKIIESESQPANPIQPIPSDLGEKTVGDLTIGFGLEVLAAEQRPQTYKVVSYEDPNQPLPSTYVTFVFRYRSPEFLVAQGIATKEELSPKRAGKRKRSESRPAEPRRTASQSRARHPAAEEEEEPSPFAVSPKEVASKKSKKRKVDTASIGSHALPTEMQPPVAKRHRVATSSNMGPPPSHAESSTSSQIQFFLPAPPPSFQMPPGLPTLNSLSMGSAQTSTVNSPVAIDQAQPNSDQPQRSLPNYPSPQLTQPPWPQNALLPPYPFLQNGLPQNGLPQNALPQNALPQNALPQNALLQNALPPNPVPVQYSWPINPLLPSYVMGPQYSQPQTTLPAQYPPIQYTADENTSSENTSGSSQHTPAESPATECSASADAATEVTPATHTFGKYTQATYRPGGGQTAAMYTPAMYTPVMYTPAMYTPTPAAQNPAAHTSAAPTPAPGPAAQLPAAQTSVASTPAPAARIPAAYRPAPVAQNPAVTFTTTQSVQALIAQAARVAREVEEANARTQAPNMATAHTFTRTPVERTKTPTGFLMEDYVNM